MNILRHFIEDVFKKYIDLQENDVILYLGGRIDDDKLYPPKYAEYLNTKIKELQPTKIICHTHWYAKKYYENGILSGDTKIDMVLAYYHYLVHGKLQGINPKDYSDHRAWMKILIDKNPNMVYAMYISDGKKPPSVSVNGDWFREDYDLNNVKYFFFNRRYSPKDLTDGEFNKGKIRNATDGFAIISGLVKSGFDNLNILGFSAFGSDEDQSYFSEYGEEDPRFAGQKYFDLKTSEDQRMEADILQYWVQSKKINNLENYGKLMSHLEEK